MKKGIIYSLNELKKEYKNKSQGKKVEEIGKKDKQEINK